MTMAKRKLLWVGDAGVATGFARATHHLCDWLHASGEWDVEVLGINYYGDPDVQARWPYKIHPCMTERGGDPLGMARLPEICARHRPDVVVVLQDPWFIPHYRAAVGTTPLVVWLAVDGKNLRADEYLAGVNHAIFWTEFAKEEARLGGFAGHAGVVPLGVDLELYRPLPRQEARVAWGLKGSPAETGYIVGNVNRNQPRKRLELTIDYFAEWVLEDKVHDAYLMLHLAPTGEHAVDVKQLMGYYGIPHRLILSVPPTIGQGVPEKSLAGMYSAFDVMLSTTQGEGFGLTTFEAMAAGVPCIAPDWSALGELLAGGAGELVPCSTISVTAGSRSFPAGNIINPNVIGGVPDKAASIEALRKLYADKSYRAELADRGRARVGEDRFRWSNIGEAFHRELEAALEPRITRYELPKDGAASASGNEETDAGNA
jgi:glycosyltransferase involved in cell wall biosynthesis